MSTSQNKTTYTNIRTSPLNKWKDDFDWLEYEIIDNEVKMFCTLCKKNNKRNNFAKGCIQYKRDVLNKHEDSKEHKESKYPDKRQKKLHDILQQPIQLIQPSSSSLSSLPLQLPQSSQQQLQQLLLQQQQLQQQQQQQQQQLQQQQLQPPLLPSFTLLQQQQQLLQQQSFLLRQSDNVMHNYMQYLNNHTDILLQQCQIMGDQSKVILQSINNDGNNGGNNNNNSSDSSNSNSNSNNNSNRKNKGKDKEH
jgi:hypothetical protein